MVEGSWLDLTDVVHAQIPRDRESEKGKHQHEGIRQCKPY